MKTIARLAVVFAWVPIVYAVWFFDAVREAAKKRRLGAKYEGPLED